MALESSVLRRGVVYGLRTVTFFIGYLLSPLSWWNDLFINAPLAYLFASIFKHFTPLGFSLLFSIGYCLSNILGILLMKLSISLSRRNFYRDLVLSIIYSVIAYIILSYILGV